jgi:hypothetical protein
MMHYIVPILDGTEKKALQLESFAKFLLNVHKVVDGEDHWTLETLIVYLSKRGYQQICAPIIEFHGIPQTNICEDTKVVNVDVDSSDVNMILHLLPREESKDEAIDYQQFSKPYIWEGLISLMYKIVLHQGKHFNFLPIKSKCLIFFALPHSNVLILSSSGVTSCKTWPFHVCYNRVLGYDDHCKELEDAQSIWRSLNPADKTKEKLNELVSTFFTL